MEFSPSTLVMKLYKSVKGKLSEGGTTPSSQSGTAPTTVHDRLVWSVQESYRASSELSGEDSTSVIETEIEYSIDAYIYTALSRLGV